MLRYFFILKSCLFYLIFTFFRNILKSSLRKIATGIKDQIAFIYVEELRIATKDYFTSEPYGIEFNSKHAIFERILKNNSKNYLAQSEYSFNQNKIDFS